MKKAVLFLLPAIVLAMATAAEAQQGARYERWNGASVNSPQDLANNPSLLGNPGVSQTLVNFEAPLNVSGQFVARITAQFTAPETGLYVFWVASNGHSMAWWSTSQSFAGRVPMARMTRTTVPTRNQWTRNCEQKSGIATPVTCPDGVVNPAVNLTAGQTIYLLMVYSDPVVEAGTNVNHASLKWMLPSGVQEGPIPGVRISVPSTPPPTTGSVGLSWDPENTSGHTAGYRILYGPSSGNWPQTHQVGSPVTTSITGLPTGSRLYFVVVAHNSSGQAGPPSNEVSCIPAAGGPCGSVLATAMLTWWNSSSAFTPKPPPDPDSGSGLPVITGEGSTMDALQPADNLPNAPRQLTVDPTVDSKDTWPMDMSGWSLVSAVSWTAEAENPERIAVKDWILHPGPHIELPGPMVPAFDIPYARDGSKFLTKSVYVPGEGERFAVIRGADWRTHNAVLLVTFQLQAATATELKVAQTGLVAQLEGSGGFAIYLKGMDGSWSASYLGPDEPFAILFPGALPWLMLHAQR